MSPQRVVDQRDSTIALIRIFFIEGMTDCGRNPQRTDETSRDAEYADRVEGRISRAKLAAALRADRLEDPALLSPPVQEGLRRHRDALCGPDARRFADANKAPLLRKRHTP